jgi:hypothetical protein
MTDDTMLAELRAELAKQREDSDARYDALVAELDRQNQKDEEPKPLTAAGVAETLSRGYEQDGGES